MKTKTTALKDLAEHLERISRNSRGHGGHGWTYDEEIEMLHTAAAEIQQMNAAIKEYVSASIVNVPASRVQDAWENLKAIAAPSNDCGQPRAKRVGL
jgi:hypothetical protein